MDDSSSEEDLEKMAKALNLKETSSQDILTKLLQLQSSCDNKGNAILESDGMINGSSVVAAVTKKGEVYVRVLPSKTESSQEASNNDETKEDEKSDVEYTDENLWSRQTR